MSRGAEQRPSPRARAIELSATIAAPAVLGLALVSLLTGGSDAAQHDLHLVLPERGVAGSRVPARAQLYTGLERAEGPRLLSARVSLELIDEHGTPRSRVQMRPGYRNTLEAELALPPGTTGALRVRAHATLGGATIELLRPIRIEPVGRAVQYAKPRPRASRALAALALGPLRKTDEGAASSARLEARVRGGACSPQATCGLLVDAGDAVLAVAAEPSASARPLHAEPVLGPVASFELRTDGPEASLELRALREGRMVARRSVRLPIALGTDALTLERMQVAPHEPVRFRLQLPNGEVDGCIIDAFVGGAWVRSKSVPDCSKLTALPFEINAPAIVRLQARRDPFSSESAAVRVLLARAEGEAPASTLKALARAALIEAPDDVLAKRVLVEPEAFIEAHAAVGAYLSAVLEQGIMTLPPPSTSQPLALEQLSLERARARRLALWMLALAAASLVTVIVQRGLRAEKIATDILREAGQAHDSLAPARRRMRLRTVLSAASLVLAFAVIALYVWVRGMG